MNSIDGFHVTAKASAACRLCRKFEEYHDDWHGDDGCDFAHSFDDVGWEQRADGAMVCPACAKEQSDE